MNSEEIKRPSYINPNRKKVSKKELLKLLKEMNAKHKAERIENARATAEALRSGFYCTGGRTNIKPLL